MHRWVTPLTLFGVLSAAAALGPVNVSSVSDTAPAVVAPARAGTPGQPQARGLRAGPDFGGAGTAWPTLFQASTYLSFDTTTKKVDSDPPNDPKNPNKQDTEPVVVTIRRQGTPYTLTAYMKWFPESSPIPNPSPTPPLTRTRIHYAGTSDFASFDKGELRTNEVYRGGVLITNTGYDRSGDPFCSANPSTSGVNPRTIYCVGTMSSGKVGTTYTRGGIGLWKLSETAPNFADVRPVELDTSWSPRFLDKPSIAVSGYAGTVGHVYAAAVDLPVDSSDNTGHIRFYYSIDDNNGGITYMRAQLDPNTFSGPEFHSPIVVADSFRNDVYLIWQSRANNLIYLARGVRTGNEFFWGARQQIYAGGAGQTLLGPPRDFDKSSISPSGFYAVSMIMARYNWVARSIGVVWHTRESAGTPATFVPTDVSFASFDTLTQTWGARRTVGNRRTVDANARAALGTSQWAPALDYDESGNYLVTYYDNRDDTGGAGKYRLYASRVNRHGECLDPDRSLSGSEPPGQVAFYPEDTLGEYHDVWYFLGTWYVAWINVPFNAAVGDAYITRALLRVNHALSSNGSTATASSTYSPPNASYHPLTVINGDRKGLGWGTSAGGGWHDITFNSYPDWVQVDFNGPKTINEIDVVTIQDDYMNPKEPCGKIFAQTGITAFDVQYWTASGWQTIPGASVSGNREVLRRFTFDPVTTSSIRVLVNDALGSYSRITEVEAWGPPTSNVALASNGATATASSTYSTSYSDYPASAVINGDRRGTGWGGLPGGGWHDITFNSYPDWVQVDFNGPKTINEIDVVTIQDDYMNPVEPTEAMTFRAWGITDFDVQYWNGSFWATIPGGSVSANNKVWRKFTFPGVTTSGIRVSVNNAAGNYSRITEVEAWGRDAP